MPTQQHRRHSAITQAVSETDKPAACRDNPLVLLASSYLQHEMHQYATRLGRDRQTGSRPPGSTMQPWAAKSQVATYYVVTQ